MFVLFPTDSIGYSELYRYIRTGGIFITFGGVHQNLMERKHIRSIYAEQELNADGL